MPLGFSIFKRLKRGALRPSFLLVGNSFQGRGEFMVKYLLLPFQVSSGTWLTEFVFGG
ncbi:hypothetical protein C1G86_0572 [Dehalococcoides mccartyi]|uniref:Uncharacterized protein n=1 Tax=Dehalococcoides mccartyi TaxID=61435 RepID=A0A328ESJ2_9CHLR|nr:hypothetical protein C1G86_0572 [Dehalococcoides mccartyi]